MSDPASSVLKLKRLKQEAQEILEEPAPEGTFQTDSLPVWKQFLQFWAMAVRSFWKNRCPARASALAYTTLLALVPLLALVIGVSTSLLKKQGDRPIESLIENIVARVAPQLDLVSKNPNADVQDGRREVVKNISNYIGRIRSGALNVTGVLGLVFVAVSMLATIETAFNDIWGVQRGRSWFSRVVHYWAAISLGPLLLALAVGVTTGSHFATTRAWVESLPVVGMMFVTLLPFAILSLGFALFYQLMPNTRVNWRAALVGGAVGGCLWQINNELNVLYASKVFTYTTIYGSMSILPVFLVGLYFSWMILLFGAQVSYAYQNRRAYMQGLQADAVNQSGREFIAVRIMTRIASHFQKGDKPLASSELARDLDVPLSLVSRILNALVQAGLLNEASSHNHPGFAPARPLDQITVHQVMQALRSGNGKALPTRQDETLGAVQSHVATVQQAEAEAASRVTIQQLVSESVSAGTKAKA